MDLGRHARTLCSPLESLPRVTGRGKTIYNPAAFVERSARGLPECLVGAQDAGLCGHSNEGFFEAMSSSNRVLKKLRSLIIRRPS